MGSLNPARSAPATPVAASRQITTHHLAAVLPTSSKAQSGTLTSQAMACPCKPPSTQQSAVNPNVSTRDKRFPARFKERLQSMINGVEATARLHPMMMPTPQRTSATKGASYNRDAELARPLRTPEISQMQ